MTLTKKKIEELEKRIEALESSKTIVKDLSKAGVYFEIAKILYSRQDVSNGDWVDSHAKYIAKEYQKILEEKSL